MWTTFQFHFKIRRKKRYFSIEFLLDQSISEVSHGLWEQGRFLCTTFPCKEIETWKRWNDYNPSMCGTATAIATKQALWLGVRNYRQKTGGWRLHTIKKRALKDFGFFWKRFIYFKCMCLSVWEVTGVMLCYMFWNRNYRQLWANHMGIGN